MPDVNRRCARPGCGRPATTTLSYVYAQRTVWLDDLHDEDSPANHDLCTPHGDRTQPPKGWELSDRRNLAPVQRLPDVGRTEVIPCESTTLPMSPTYLSD